MTQSLFSKNAWDVLLLFVVPIGGGIPAGVALAKARGLMWPIMMFLYFVSDCLLALVFEPIMHMFLKASEKRQSVGRVRQALAHSIKWIGDRYGLRPNPLTLIFITFSTDPMTGRCVAKGAGHGFFTGWALTIAGDMVFFSLIMVSTLWLNHILGDGTWAAIIVTIAIVLLQVARGRREAKR